MSLAGTAPSCMGCAGRAYPPFILSEVATLAGCPVCHPRRFQETCSPASRFCGGRATDRTGAVVASIIHKQGCGIRLGKKGKWGRERDDCKTKRGLPTLFTPGGTASQGHIIFYKYLFVYLAVLGLGCIRWDGLLWRTDSPVVG